ncbi:MAG: HAD family hydrolase [Syntrophales bacterium]
MAIRGILFDLYGTLIDIETDESMEEIYRGIAHYLTYQGVTVHRWEVRDRYYQIMKEQKEACSEECPEIDVERIWTAFLEREGMPAGAERERLALTLAQIYRGISRKRLQLYPGVREVLDELCPVYQLAIVSDAQPGYALPEMKAVGLGSYFDPVIISAQFGYRKPDRRLMEKALGIMKLLPAEVLFVGNDMYRDIYGAGRLGIKTIFIDSNQGDKSHETTTPDYVAHRFADVLKGVAALAGSLPAAH